MIVIGGELGAEGGGHSEGRVFIKCGADEAVEDGGLADRGGPEESDIDGVCLGGLWIHITKLYEPRWLI